MPTDGHISPLARVDTADVLTLVCDSRECSREWGRRIDPPELKKIRQTDSAKDHCRPGLGLFILRLTVIGAAP